jgi:hypothetical protein
MIDDITPPQPVNPQNPTPATPQLPKAPVTRLRRQPKRTNPLARKQGLQLHKFPQPHELLQPKQTGSTLQPAQVQGTTGFGSGALTGSAVGPSALSGAGNNALATGSTQSGVKGQKSTLHIAARAAQTAVAAQTEPSPYLPMVVSHTDGTMQVQPAIGRGWQAWRHWRPTRLQWLIGGAAAVLLIVGGSATWALTHHKTPVVAVKTVKHTPKPKPVVPQIIYSTLTGLPVPDASINQRPVVGAMIENSLDARPQSGLSEAGVVFEAVAEGGVTRFLALFQDTSPADIGPIRSARPYYVQWAMGFDAAYAHVGGSPDALNDIKAWGTHDMNQFANGGSYHRISSRAAPHNVYTSVEALRNLATSKGYGSSYTGFTHTIKDAPSAAPNATSLDFKLSGYTYDPHYAYNASTNSYDRSEAGDAHTDANTGKQISPKVVIAIVVPLVRGALDSSGAYYSDYNPIGSGTAYIFQNGVVTPATWNKSGNGAPLTFTDANGQNVPLNPGQAWISAVSAASGVIYK